MLALTKAAAFTPALVMVAFVAGISAALVLIVPALNWLPKPSEAGTLLGSLLGAQAAIAALTLAVTLFVMQGISARRDVDDRMYLEYVRRSWVRIIFRGSLAAVAVTGAVLMTEKFIGGQTTLADSIPSLRNLALIAVLAFFTNMGFAGALFEQAVRLAKPEQWRNLRRDVNQRDVRQAVQIFLGRRYRAVTSLEANTPDITAVFPDAGEGSADEAVRALLDDARRAMVDRRQGEFARSLDSLRELVTYAMDEIEKAGLNWAPPGAQPEWPPLRELERNLYTFREEVIREGSREYLFELLGIDYWLASTGVKRRCGDLFTAGLDGYRRNYQIVNRIGNTEFHEMLRDRFLESADYLLLGIELEEAFPYAREIIHNQERMLSDAMHGGHHNDYDRLHKGFQVWLRKIRHDWDINRRRHPGTAEPYDNLEQQYRIVLMGLAGRAADLAQADRMADPTPYLGVARAEYPNPRQLADDIAQAISKGEQSGFSMWSEWQMEGAERGQAIFIAPEQYPLSFFTIRLIEMAADPMPSLALHGRAKRVQEWFGANSERLKSSVLDDDTIDVEKRCDVAASALQAAVHRDEVEEDLEIIRRNLSQERVSNLISEVYATAFATNVIESKFERAGTFLYVQGDSEYAPEERGIRELVGKGFFTEATEGAGSYYVPLNGVQWGCLISNDAAFLLCEALDSAPEIIVQVDAPEEFLSAIDNAKRELNPAGEIVIVLAGDWFDLESTLNRELPDGYEPGWRLSQNEELEEVARYQGHSILRGPRNGERRIYIVDPKSWGCLIRAQFENEQDLRVEVNPVSPERAEELLNANPSHYANEPNKEGKLRKLQSQVEVIVGARIEFREIDDSRARRIVSPSHNPDQADDTPSPQ